MWSKTVKQLAKESGVERFNLFPAGTWHPLLSWPVPIHDSFPSDLFDLLRHTSNELAHTTSANRKQLTRWVDLGDFEDGTLAEKQKTRIQSIWRAGF
jgi:hypothetical protein